MDAGGSRKRPRTAGGDGRASLSGKTRRRAAPSAAPTAAPASGGAAGGAHHPMAPPTWDDLFDGLEAEDARPSDMPTARPHEVDLGRQFDKDTGERVAVGNTMLRGRLKTKLDSWWRKTGASKRIQRWIEHGFELPWVDGARPRGLDATNRVKRGDIDKTWGIPVFDWVTQCVREFIEVGAALKWEVARHMPGVINEPVPRCICPLNVCAKKTKGKLRLLWDLRALNAYLRSTKFRLQTLSSMRHYLRKGSRFMDCDVRSAYIHVDVAPSQWTYLGFRWNGTLYCFTQFPFGGNWCPYAYSKLAAHVADVLRQKGITTIQYLDDYLFIFDQDDMRERLWTHVWPTFAASGFVLNEEKSSHTPVVRCTHQGFVLDGDAGTFSLTESRRTECISLAQECVAAGSGAKVSARALARLAGKLMSLSLVMGLSARVMTMDMAFALAKRTGLSPERISHPCKFVRAAAARASWNGTITLDEPIVSACQWWIATLQDSPSKPFDALPQTYVPFAANIEEAKRRHKARYRAAGVGVRPSLDIVECGGGVDVLVATDAGTSDGGGWVAETTPEGGVNLDEREDFVFDGSGRPEFARDAHSGDNLTSSALRELRALLDIVHRVRDRLAGRRVRFVLDSQAAVVSLLEGRSRVAACHALIRAIYVALWEANVVFRWYWVERDRNAHADFLTHVREIGFWRAAPETVAACAKFLGVRRFRLDAFASAKTAVADRFCSRFPEPGSLGRYDDLDWGSRDAVWAFPPAALVSGALAHARRCKSFGVLFVPATRESWWRPLLHRARLAGNVKPFPWEAVKDLNLRSLTPHVRGPHGWEAVKFDFRDRRRRS